MNVLEVKGISKHLSGRLIIDNISFNIKEGEIFGFLGPNGAGKTTTIRMLVGLISPENGAINILGSDIQKQKVAALKNVGAVVENPELYTYLTGFENLKQLSRIYGNISDEDIYKVVDLVGLTPRIKDRVKKYSLGMKQRLGLAEALLANPKLLILDEPTNGLDPTGIIEFRNIVRKAAKENGMAVFVSSHILSEVSQLCDTVAFIDKGKIKSIESVKGVVSASEYEDVIILPKDITALSKALEKLTYIQGFTPLGSLIEVSILKGKTSDMILDLSKDNVLLEEIYKKRSNLEDRYVEVVEGGKM